MLVALPSALSTLRCLVGTAAMGPPAVLEPEAEECGDNADLLSEDETGGGDTEGEDNTEEGGGRGGSGGEGSAVAEEEEEERPDHLTGYEVLSPPRPRSHQPSRNAALSAGALHSGALHSGTSASLASHLALQLARLVRCIPAGAPADGSLLPVSGAGLAFTRYCFASKLYCGSQSSSYSPPPICKA